MIVMPSNNMGHEVRDLFRRFPDRMAHLFSPDGWRNPWAGYALDNGAFGAWRNGTAWDEPGYRAMLDKAATVQPPLWALVPDVVADREGTLRSWDRWALVLRSAYAFPLAFACQDGMSLDDVPPDADVLFVGGSTKWKWSSLPMWCEAGRRIHVGRVNSPSALFHCRSLGVESVDGTGWCRGDRVQWRGLVSFLESDGCTNHRGQYVLAALCPDAKTEEGK